MEFIASLMLTMSGLAAPVPAEPLPDPLAWGYLGVRVGSESLQIVSVEPNTPASKAGLRADDEFVKVGKLHPTNFVQVVQHISSFRPGSVLKVEVRRAGALKEVTVRLGERPADLPSPYRSELQEAAPIP